MGNANSGRPGGNPDIVAISRQFSTGPKTDEGKLRCQIPRYRPWSKSRLIKKFRRCDNCPLRPRTEERMTKEGVVEIEIPAKCKQYNFHGLCQVSQKEWTQKLELFYRVGENMGTLELQKVIAYSLLEDAELAKEAEMMEGRKPGFYTAKFKELAKDTVGDLNKIVHGTVNKNLNVNVNMTDAIIDAYKKRVGDKNGKVVSDKPRQESEGKI